MESPSVEKLFEWFRAPTLVVRGVRIGATDPRQFDVSFVDGVIRALHPWPRDNLSNINPSVAHSINIFDGVLVPGFWDSHIHLGAWIRAQMSTPVPVSNITTKWLEIAHAESMRRTSVKRAGPRWLVGFGLDHHHDRQLARAAIDRTAQPVVLVHQTGRGALLNQAAGALLGGIGPFVTSGIGSIWRRALGVYGDDLRAFEVESLGRLRNMLIAQGVTRVTDATPYPHGAQSRQSFLAGVMRPLQIEFMQAPSRDFMGSRWVKYLRLPDAADLQAAPSAFHATEPDEILGAVELARILRMRYGCPSRIEHAALCPPHVARALSESDVLVAMNPGFRIDRPEAARRILDQGLDDYWHPVWSVWGRRARCSVGSDAPVGQPGVRSSQLALAQRSEWSSKGSSMTWALLSGDSQSVRARPEDWLNVRKSFVIMNQDGLASPAKCTPSSPVIVGFGSSTFARFDRIQ